MGAVVALGVIGIGAAVFMSTQSNQQKSLNGSQLTLTRNMLQIQLQQSLINPGAMAVTLSHTADTGNAGFKACLQPTGASCAHQPTPKGFSLYEPGGTKIAGSGAGEVLRYDTSGQPCTTASSQCSIEVFTEYKALCPGAAATCANPSVTAAYTIQSAAGVNPPGGLVPKPLRSGEIPLSVAGLSAGGPGGVCGGYVTKYPSGAWCSSCTHATFGCGIAGGNCPAGYSAMPSAFVTVNNYENTWLCVKN